MWALELYDGEFENLRFDRNTENYRNPSMAFIRLEPFAPLATLRGEAIRPEFVLLDEVMCAITRLTIDAKKLI